MFLSTSLPFAGPPAPGVPGLLELFVLLVVLLPVVAFVALVVLAVRYLQRDPPGSRRDPAVEELRLALARGELTPEEYERRMELLQERPGDDQERR